MKEFIYSSHNFTGFELTHSDTANRLRIKNDPPEELHANGKMLIDFLQRLREAWGNPIKVNSGYRCPDLNKALAGSSDTSVHKLFLAADIVPMTGSFEEFVAFVKDWIKDEEFDQCIIESNSAGAKWLHLGLRNNKGEARKQIKVMNV